MTAERLPQHTDFGERQARTAALLRNERIEETRFGDGVP